MRVTYYFLLVCAVLGRAGATSTGDQTTIATVASPNQNTLLYTDTENVIEGKRFLRAQPTNTADQEGKDEERFFKNALQVSKLEDILTNTDGKQLAKFASWNKQGYTSKQVTERIKQFFPTQERYWAIGFDYGLYRMGQRPLSNHKRLSPEELAKITVHIP
ncbi:Avirulence (Avh) protein [Phytophthora megakarya]|uniref:RxLR effector protein n=1 Tax=Phytophthora megakarya TaxID=4795 RepID=A0A225WKL3_9STRA|nr:Avirulence (Avh) protein [Phytophthora megakarya]